MTCARARHRFHSEQTRILGFEHFRLELADLRRTEHRLREANLEVVIPVAIVAGVADQSQVASASNTNAVKADLATGDFAIRTETRAEVSDLVALSLLSSPAGLAVERQARAPGATRVTPHAGAPGDEMAVSTLRAETVGVAGLAVGGAVDSEVPLVEGLGEISVEHPVGAQLRERRPRKALVRREHAVVVKRENVEVDWKRDEQKQVCDRIAVTRFVYDQAVQQSRIGRDSVDREQREADHFVLNGLIWG